MDSELEGFEEKINSITEQFMSLLDSNDVIDGSGVDKFDNTSVNVEGKTNNTATVFNTGFDSISIDTGITGGYEEGYKNNQKFEFEAGNVKIGGIAYGNTDSIQNGIQNGIPNHGIRFDSVGEADLDKKLDELYESKKNTYQGSVGGNPTIAFSDSNVGNGNNYGYGNYNGKNYKTSGNYNVGSNNAGHNGTYGNYTKEETGSTLNNKEGYEMSEYNGEKKENAFYSFATIPAEKSLVESRNWKETLFMDIPWDTKIDIWGGIKKLFTAKISISFD